MRAFICCLALAFAAMALAQSRESLEPLTETTWAGLGAIPTLDRDTLPATAEVGDQGVMATRTERAPLPIKDVGSDPRGEARDDEARERSEKAIAERWTIISTVVSAAAATVSAVFTIVLGVFTIGLWRQTKKASAAAAASANIAERALVSSQRASVFGVGFYCRIRVIEGVVTAYFINVDWKNYGPTHATDLRGTIGCIFRKVGNDHPVIFKMPEPAPVPAVLGPQQTHKSFEAPISADMLQQCWLKQQEIFVWSRVEYRDTFDPGTLHHHEMCAQITFVEDPAIPPPKGTSHGIIFDVWGEQNTSA